MRSVVIGGNSRNIGKTSLAVSLISATRDLDWTAVKVTRFGHGICSRSGSPCDCAIANPQCPYDISVEKGAIPSTDTARMLSAGAAEVLWVRVAMGCLDIAMPSIRSRLEGREHVIFESNSILQYWMPDAHLSVLQYDLEDCKGSAKRGATVADAFVLPPSSRANPEWDGFPTEVLDSRRRFEVVPPSYCTPEIVAFVRGRLLGSSQPMGETVQ